MIEEIKTKIEEAICKTMLKVGNIDLFSSNFYIGTAYGYMRALDIIKEVENDKNNQ